MNIAVILPAGIVAADAWRSSEQRKQKIEQRNKKRLKKREDFLAAHKKKKEEADAQHQSKAAAQSRSPRALSKDKTLKRLKTGPRKPSAEKNE